jgi:hypothetical protein
MAEGVSCQPARAAWLYGGTVMPRPFTAGDAAAEGAPLGHTGAALGGEAGGSYENRCCFRRLLVIDQFFWRDF